MGHVIEHIALAIQTLAGMDCGFGRTRGTGAPGVYNVVFEYKVKPPAATPPRPRCALPRPSSTASPTTSIGDVQALRDIATEHFPGPSTNAILEEARSRGIPVLTLGHNGLYQLGYGARQRRIRASMGSTTSCIAVDIAGDKDETKQLLQDAGIPVPKGTIIKDPEELPRAIDAIGFPLVVKPLDGTRARALPWASARPKRPRRRCNWPPSTPPT
jgi:cyanophycin synthetase